MLSNQIKRKAIQVADAGAFMILFLLTVVAVIATWLIPAGAYSKLSYEPASQELKIVNPHHHVKKSQELKKNLIRWA